MLPAFIATLTQPKWFAKVIQFHQVGAGKQRLYVENLLAIPMPAFPRELQTRAAAPQLAADTAREVEAMILGQPDDGVTLIDETPPWTDSAAASPRF